MSSTLSVTGNITTSGTITSAVYDGFVVQNVNMYNQNYTYTMTVNLANGLYFFHAFYGYYNTDGNLMIGAIGVSMSGNITTTLSQGTGYFTSLSISGKTLTVSTNSIPGNYNSASFNCTYKKIHTF
jgi:hypothetical protein